MSDLPVVDEQEFDDDAEIREVEECINGLEIFGADRGLIARAIYYLQCYCDLMAYEKERGIG